MSDKPIRFWRLHSPPYDSDYRCSYINGHLEHPYALPGVECDKCGDIWGGTRILQFECPASLRKHKLLTNLWPIPLEQHEALQHEVGKHLSLAGINHPKLRPGDCFQPGYLDVPSRPQDDFLWCSMSVVVSERIKRLFDSAQIRNVVFCPVVLRKIGSREASLEPPIPSTGEPEDIIDEVPILRRTNSISPYYEMLVLSKSDYPPGGVPVSVCSACGYETIDDDKRKLVMLSSMWRGDNLFYLATTSHIIITERLKNLLLELKVTNVDFTPYNVE